ALAGLVSTLRVHTQRMSAGASTGFALATDLAEFLVRRGVPFREAHEVVGHLVVWCQVHECDLPDVSDQDLAKISAHLTPDIREVLSVRGALAARKAHGGTVGRGRNRSPSRLPGCVGWSPSTPPGRRADGGRSRVRRSGHGASRWRGAPAQVLRRARARGGAPAAGMRGRA